MPIAQRQQCLNTLYTGGSVSGQVRPSTPSKWNRRAGPPGAPERTGLTWGAASRGNPEMLDDAVGRRGDQQGGGAAKAHARDRRLVVREACNRGPTLGLVNAANGNAREASGWGADRVHKRRMRGDARHKHWGQFT